MAHRSAERLELSVVTGINSEQMDVVCILTSRRGGLPWWGRPGSEVSGLARRGVRRLTIGWFRVLVTAVVVASVVLVIVLRPTAQGDPAMALEALPMVDRVTQDASYRRAAFGDGWSDLDGDGCRTRDEVLLSTVDRSQPYRTRRQGRCGADMVAGTWTDLYTGQRMTWSNLKDTTQAQAIPIDHIVSLAAAYRYGAKTWSEQDRIAFANDELNLTPTTAAINQAKADKDPASWTPPAAGRCAYATRYIAVKTRYRLPVDHVEKTSLQQLLRGCPRG